MPGVMSFPIEENAVGMFTRQIEWEKRKRVKEAAAAAATTTNDGGGKRPTSASSSSIRLAYKAKEEGKVVVYTTSSGIVRLTFYNCMKVKQILNTHMVKYEEKDLFRSAELQTELRDRIGCTAIQVPQLFVGGQYIGDADTVERLNESGELRRMLKPYQVIQDKSLLETSGEKK
uniref:Glutaredoxin domain-containing protein n=1 Tax=Vespula pensylvanica TaxID=30213 RepID=A0A834PA86_VESPE|nr:hypothetical protein H0235_002429 [Vespula pensylvanica]